MSGSGLLLRNLTLNSVSPDGAVPRFIGPAVRDIADDNRGRIDQDASERWQRIVQAAVELLHSEDEDGSKRANDLGGERRRAADTELVSIKRQDNEHSGRRRKQRELPRRIDATKVAVPKYHLSDKQYQKQITRRRYRVGPYAAILEPFAIKQADRDRDAADAEQCKPGHAGGKICQREAGIAAEDNPPEACDRHSDAGIAGIFDAADGSRLRQRHAARAKYDHRERPHGAVDCVANGGI